MRNFIKEWVIPALVALIIVLALNTFIFKLVTVPSGSMISTIMPGDKLYVNQLVDKSNLQRGQIIVFHSRELDKLMVKRLIGLPNDTVDIKYNGEIYINGVKLDEPYATECTTAEKVFQVPEDCYFFLGDNRPNSADARHWDNPYINKEDVVGQAIFRFFPFDRIGQIK